MNVNKRCQLCGFTHHFYDQAGSCRSFGVKTFAEKKIAELESKMTMWIAIEHAPKDRPVDLWVISKDGIECRIPEARWWSTRGQGEWCIDVDGFRRPAIVDKKRWIVTHYMLIPEGPNGTE